MRFKIVNKKIFTLFICTTLAIIFGLSFGVYFLAKKIFEIKNGERNKIVEISVQENKEEVQQKEISIVDIDNQNSANEAKKEVVEDQISQANSEIVSLVEYENQSYRYSVQFPDNWKMNNDFSEAKIEETDKKKGLNSGGQTFWSNYENINKYNPNNKPEDFRLLSLTVYSDESKSIQDFAEKIGVKEISLESEIKAKNTTGFEYIYSTGDDKNPSITAIFNKDNYFYVFKPAFVNGDEKAAEIMENIVKSMVLL